MCKILFAPKHETKNPQMKGEKKNSSQQYTVIHSHNCRA